MVRDPRIGKKKKKTQVFLQLPTQQKNWTGLDSQLVTEGTQVDPPATSHQDQTGVQLTPGKPGRTGKKDQLKTTLTIGHRRNVPTPPFPPSV